MIHEEADTERLSLRILSHNIRYAISSPSENERPWNERCPLILRQLKHHVRYLDGISGSSPPAASFIYLQETLHSQLQDILVGLNSIRQSRKAGKTDKADDPVWGVVGVGRDDGKTAGEYNPILYPTDTFELLDFETRWLSPTPEQPSMGWDAGSKRILTAAVFEHRRNLLRIVACNTHLDNQGRMARKRSIPLILATIQQIRSKWAGANSTGPLVFLAGDFNSFPTQEAYVDMAASGILADVVDYVPEGERYGNEVTFTGFVPGTDKDKADIGRIDFAWIGPKEHIRALSDERGNGNRPSWDVRGYAVLPNVFDDGIFCSDHRCLVSDITLHSN